jgi:excisionase family DNA binding protein
MQTRRNELASHVRFDRAPQQEERLTQPTVEILLLQVIQLLQAQHQEPKVEEQQAAQDETFDVKETAKYLRVSEWTVYDMCRTKTLPFFKIRARLFFRKRELDNWIHNQQQGPQ